MIADIKSEHELISYTLCYLMSFAGLETLKGSKYTSHSKMLVYRLSRDIGPMVDASKTYSVDEGVLEILQNLVQKYISLNREVCEEGTPFTAYGVLQA